LLKSNYGTSCCSYATTVISIPTFLLLLKEAAMKCCGTTKFSKATDGVSSDSLYKLSLNGSEGKFGF
jgi:hypothetical protein